MNPLRPDSTIMPSTSGKCPYPCGTPEGRNERPLAPGQVEEGFRQLDFGSGAPKPDCKVTTLARPHHEKRGQNVPTGVMNCAKEVAKREKVSRQCRETTVLCPVCENVFHVSDKTNGLCSGYFHDESSFRGKSPIV